MLAFGSEKPMVTHNNSFANILVSGKNVTHTNLYIYTLHCIYHTLYPEIPPHYIRTLCE